MRINKYFIVPVILLAGFISQSYAQKTGPVALDSFLNYLENRFEIVFSYADANIEGIWVTISDRDLSLDEFLMEIQNQTELNFRKVNSRYIAIQKDIPGIRISGTVIDRSTGEKLVGAVIYSGDKHTLCNERGFFSITLDPLEDSILIIRHVGYKPLKLAKDKWSTDSSLFEMIIDIQVLEEVTLNYISRGIDKLNDGSVRLNVQNMEMMPGLSEPDMLNVIQVLPGIQSINETVSDINTRGGTNDQNLVLWDGVKMYQTGHFFGMISAFNSQLIHKTLVIKNGTSAFYDEGVSGVIDMRQQDYLVKDPEFSVGINMVSADITAKIPVGSKLSLILGARRSINDIVRTPTYISYYKRAFEHTEVMLAQAGADTSVENYQDFSFYDVSARLLYDISEKDKLRLSVLNNKNKIKYEESATIRDTLYTRESYLTQSNLLSGLDYTRSWSETHSTYLSAYVSSYHLDGRNVSILDNQNHLQENEVLDWGIKLGTINKINRKVVLSGGYQFKELGIRNLDNIRKPNYTRDVKDVLRIHSMYTEAECQELFRKLYVRAGLRISYFSKFNSFSLEPRAAVTYRLSRHISVEALAEKKSQHTTQLIDYQTDFLGIEKRRWVLSNSESVPLLKSQQYSLGIQYNGNNFLISIEGYKKKVSGIITPSQGFQNQFQFIYSTGGYDSRGIELLVNKRLGKLTTWLTYTLAKNEYHFEEFTPSVFPNNLDIRHSLSLGGSLRIENFEISGGFSYRTGKPFTKPLSEELNESIEIVFEKPNSSRLKDYARLDISAKYTFKMKKLNAELDFSIWNLLNRQNIYNIFYQLKNNNEIEEITQNTLGITPNVSLRIKF